MKSSISYFYKIITSDDDDENGIDPIQNYIKEHIKNVIMNIYSTENHKYVFFETDLQQNEIDEELPDLARSIQFIISSDKFTNNKNLVYFAMVPEFLEDENNFNNLIQSFLGFFKLSELIPSILYCVRCQNSKDANKLITYTREISFDDDSPQNMLIVSNILRLPILQVTPQSFDANYVRSKFRYNIIYDTVIDKSNIFVFDSYKNAESFSSEFNGWTHMQNPTIIKHFVDDTTYSQLEKYQVRTGLSDLLKTTFDFQGEIQPNDTSRKCYVGLKSFGKVFSFQIDKKGHVKAIFEKEADAQKFVKNKKIKAQFVNNSIYICGFPPNIDKSLMFKYILEKSSNFLNNEIEEYVLEPSDSKDLNKRQYTFRIFKLHFTNIDEVDLMLATIKKLKIDKFALFAFKRKEEFKEIFNNITSSNTISISGLPKSSPVDVAKQCCEFGTIRLFLHIKAGKNLSAIVSFSKAQESENAKKDLNQFVFDGNHLSVKNFTSKQASENIFDFGLLKKSTYDKKKQEFQKPQNDPNKKAQQSKTKSMNSQPNEKNPQTPSLTVSQSVTQSKIIPIKIEKSGESQTQKQIKLEFNLPAPKLKLELFPSRKPRKEILTVFSVKLIEEEDEIDENEPIF